VFLPVDEAASPDGALAQSFVGEALRRADRDSVYRNRILALRFEPASRERYGDVERLVILEDVGFVLTTPSTGSRPRSRTGPAASASASTSVCRASSCAAATWPTTWSPT
jgi:hypothetical protein